jgi:hypothetical protein
MEDRWIQRFQLWIYDGWGIKVSFGIVTVWSHFSLVDWLVEKYQSSWVDTNIRNSMQSSYILFYYNSQSLWFLGLLFLLFLFKKPFLKPVGAIAAVTGVMRAGPRITANNAD